MQAMPKAPTAAELRAILLAAAHDSMSLTTAQHESGHGCFDPFCDVVSMTASDTLAMRSDIASAHGDDT